MFLNKSMVFAFSSIVSRFRASLVDAFDLETLVSYSLRFWTDGNRASSLFFFPFVFFLCHSFYFCILSGFPLPFPLAMLLPLMDFCFVLVLPFTFALGLSFSLAFAFIVV